MSAEHEMRTVANTIAAVALGFNMTGKQPSDMYRAMADRLADAGLLMSPELAAELESLRARVAELEVERHSTNEALDDAVQALREDKPEAPALTVFRASHDSIVMGLYRTREAARKHCETVLRRELDDAEWMGWVPEDGSDDAPEELCFSKEVLCSGYVVTPLEVASEFDAEADE